MNSHSSVESVEVLSYLPLAKLKLILVYTGTICLKKTCKSSVIEALWRDNNIVPLTTKLFNCLKRLYAPNTIDCDRHRVKHLETDHPDEKTFKKYKIHYRPTFNDYRKQFKNEKMVF